MAVVLGAVALVGSAALRADEADSPVSQLATVAEISVPATPGIEGTPRSAAANVRPASPPSSTSPPSVDSEAPSLPTTPTPATVVVAPSSTVPVLRETVPPSPVVAAPASPAEVGAAALELVKFDWRSRFGDWKIEFDGAREGLRALTFPGDRRIEVFVRPDDTAESIHRVLAHEIGHLVDVEVNSDDDRDRWRRRRGLGDSVSWWPDESKPDFATGAGDFAEAFAVWETGVTSHSTVAGQPDAADLALLEELALDR